MSFQFSFSAQFRMRWLVALLMVIAMPVFAQGQDLSELDGMLDEGELASLEVASWYKVKEGTQVGNIYVQVFIKEGYHCYSQHHAGSETNSRFVIAGSKQFTMLGKFEPARAPHKYKKKGVDYETFEEEITWSAPFSLAEGVAAEDLAIKLTYHGQACNETGCDFPIAELLEANFDGSDPNLVVREPDEGFEAAELIQPPESPVVQEVLETSEEVAALSQLYDVKTPIKFERLDGSTGNGSFWTALVGAFLGGMLLNLMPCVFPVLGLKVMGFVEQAGSEPKKIKMHGLAFAFGLIFSMWVLAGVILMIKAYGNDVTWGQQMGNPYFLGGIVILLFVLGLNLAGVFEMGLFMTRVGGGGSHKEGYAGSFVSGIVTTLVATPCSGPFLGAAMGYTLAQPALIALFLFTIFGLGIAMPYLVMSFFPSLIKMLPRPGEWMETFKKLMAFTLFAAAAFFVKPFATLTGYDGIGLFLLAMCVIALGTFLYGKYSPEYVKGVKRYVWGWFVPLLICGAGIYMYTQAAQYEAPLVVSKVKEDGWYPWVPGRVEQQLAKGGPVWVDYTADW